MMRRVKHILAGCIMLALCIGMAAPVCAAPNSLAQMEAQSRQAVETAIQAGIVPPGTTIYDCAYSRDENGVMIVVQYRDANGTWIDVTTQDSTGVQPDTSAGADPVTSTPQPAVMTEADLTAYADKVFELVNLEREKAGLPSLERSDTLVEAAAIRAEECASVNSIRVGGQAHTRPDGSRWFTVLGIDKNYNYGENTGEGKPTADIQLTSWMHSEGHRKNILREDYTETGIACAISEQGEVFAVQIFSRP